MLTVLALALSLTAAQDGTAAGSTSDADAAHAEFHGLWATSEDGGRVRVEPCQENPALLCGRLVDAAVLRAEPERLDVNNPDAELRQRPLRNARILDSFEEGGDGKWVPGTLYDPAEGRRITNGYVRLETEDTLEVRGCVAFICRTQAWTRVEEDL